MRTSLKRNVSKRFAFILTAFILALTLSAGMLPAQLVPPAASRYPVTQRPVAQPPVIEPQVGQPPIPGRTVQEGESMAQKQAQTLMDEGNYAEAYNAFRARALDPETDPMKVGEDLLKAKHCLDQLNRRNEIDELIESTIDVHSENWRLLQAAAQAYQQSEHYGFLIAGEFERGQHRGGGQQVSAMERDRVRSLQLMVDAIPLAQQDEDHGATSQFFLSLGQMWMSSRGYTASWMLQSLTDLTELPEYEEGGGYGYGRGYGGGYGGQAQGAPVDENGDPVLYAVPDTFDESVNDGERWRWCLEQAVEYNSSRRDDIDRQFADFLHQQFGVQTMASYGFFFGRMNTDDSQDRQEGMFALHTLGANETIAKLATGIKRFDLPEEYQYMTIYQELIDNRSSQWEHALNQLTSIYENRRQYPEAAELLKLGIERKGDNIVNWQRRLSQIEDAWGRFEPSVAQAEDSGKKATFEYRYRNGDRVDFDAKEIDVEKLLADVKKYIDSRPNQIDWNSINIGNIGYRLIHQDQEKYIGESAGRWREELEPRPNHFDRRITVETPMTQSGAYLVTARMRDGNTSHIVVWINDTAIAKKALDAQNLYYIGDAESGAPIEHANVEFFGWKQEHKGNRVYEILTNNIAEFSDEDGQVFLNEQRQPRDYQWLIIARTDDGRFAHFGFDHVWYQQRYDADYEATRTFAITDRPVYRPDQTVQYKFWVRHSKYDKDDVSDFAGRPATIIINNPRGEKVQEKAVTLDEFGGIDGNLELPPDAMLGVYNLNLQIGDRSYGGNSFRVEEYKKPEFEVTVDSPSEPVMLGETITATVDARYYFGEPVVHGKVKYTVKRTPHNERWYPVHPWDWFYGQGYWWFGCDSPWYPGWRHWGCPRPYPFWYPSRSTPPEVVAEQTVDIGEDGKIEIEFDTALALEMHPDLDHKYEITVEVTDQSRRTIVGSGEVLVARKPFKVHAWTDRGYYRAGDVIQPEFQARTLDGRPVEGTGEVVVYGFRLQEDGELFEAPLWRRDLNTDAEGHADLKVTAAAAGQYRIAYTLTDSKGHEIEGASLFTVYGDDVDTDSYRYNDLELVLDKAEYAPGDTAKLMINTNRKNGTVLLFVRPTNGVYLPPEVIRLRGKNTVYKFEVGQKDMPNFFVEAVTISDGRVHTEVQQICVPPEKRVLNVEVIPSADTYLPGEKANVRVRLTDQDGEPFVGTTCLSIYDKSVEYISGGSNISDIREFFWKWQRHHNPSTTSNLERTFHEITPPDAYSMQFLGVFGASVADDMDTMDAFTMNMMADDGGGMGYGGGGGGRMMAMARGGGVAEGMMMADEAMPMASMAMEAPMAYGMGAPPPAPMGQSAKGGDPSVGGPLVEATVRSNFADTALWVGSLTTEANGEAEIELDMPDNLTTWKIKVWGMGHGTRVGQGEAEVITRKGLILRMQTPRFFVQKDEVVLSANVHNYLDTDKTVQVSLEMDGRQLRVLGESTREIDVEAGGEQRVDWRVEVRKPGDAVVRMLALTDEESDAMEMTLPCLVHGMLKMEAVSGSLRPADESGEFTIYAPAERRPDETRLEVRYSPTLAGAMVDSLPYLLDYPYGCTEQTLNRFLPAVITQNVLMGMGLDLEEIREVRTNLNAQELGTHEERSAQWQNPKWDSPVFDQEKMEDIVKTGVDRLTEMQLRDGGWGWFSGYGEHSTPHTTALVVHGLQIAQENDVALVPGMLDRGVAWLKRYQKEQVELLKIGDLPSEERKGRRYRTAANNQDAFVYMVLIDADVTNEEMNDYLYRDRLKLSVYAMAMYGLALEKSSETERLDMIMRNIGQYVEQDDENQTAWLNLPQGYWWYWYGSEFEAHAYYLKLLARVEPEGDLAPRLVKYLLNNRKHATYWNSTRDTAICVEAMADFLRASGEDQPDMVVEVYYDGELKQSVEITPETLFRFDNAFVLEGADVADGEHTIELRKRGSGPLYYNGYMTNFTLEDPITAAGLEIKVQRRYYKLELDEDATAQVAGSRGQVVEQRVERYNRILLEDLSTLTSGDLVEVELEIESKNDYESIIFEDMKPAGFEPVEVRSGYNGNEMRAFVEFRDERVCFFVHRLARGNHSVSYRMRAEIPGTFSALPTKGWAMYAPELKANSDEFKIQVEDAE
jgi:alpha-2-macroglobulin